MTASTAAGKGIARYRNPHSLLNAEAESIKYCSLDTSILSGRPLQQHRMGLSISMI